MKLKKAEMLHFIFKQEKDRKQNSLVCVIQETKYIIIIDASGFKDVLIFIHEVVPS